MGADISQLKQAAPPPPDLVISDPLEEHGSNKLIPKSHSSYTHFSDYSMFPDRFNSLIPKHDPIIAPLPASKQTRVQSKSDHHYSDYSLYPDKFDEERRSAKKQKQDLSLPVSSLPAHPGLLGRFRRFSEAEHDINEDDNEKIRPRSLSHNSRMYYFDFSLIPDKDPHCAWDERKRNKSLSDQAVKPAPMPIKAITSTTDQGSSAPVRNYSMELPKKRIRQTSLSPKFSFFDYSMIPDKDPRLFTSNKQTKTEAADDDIKKATTTTTN